MSYINTKFIKHDTRIYYLSGVIKPISQVQNNDIIMGVQDGKIFPSKVISKNILNCENDWVTTNYLCYPVSNDELFIFGYYDNVIINFLKNSIMNWNHFICKNSKLFLVADENLSQSTQDFIKKAYDNGVYSLL